jgi:aspartate aminotransferase
MLYEINEKALKLESEGKKIIRLNLGDPDMATPPEIVEAAYAAMKAGKTKYSSSYGELSLRKAIADVHNVKSENVVITPGSKWAIFATMFLTLKSGGNVIIPTPYWTAYDLMTKSFGAKVKLLPTKMEDGWKIDPAKLKELIDSETKMIILNNPNNPTSKAFDDETLDAVVEVANRKGVTILSDEVYGAIAFKKVKSILDYGEIGKNIVSNGFSKTFTMTGWRVGYLVADKAHIDKVTKLNQITFNNVPVFIQQAALKGLELRSQIAENIKAKYKARADLASKKLKAAGFQFTEPDAPFYVFPKKNGLDGTKYTLNLLDSGVAVAPGSSFGDYPEHFRISLTAPDDQIELALDKICEAAQ